MARVTITIEFKDGFHRQYKREVDVQREPYERPYRSADGTPTLFLESGQLSILNTSKEIFANAVTIEIADTQKYAIEDCTQYSDNVLLSILPA